MGDGAEDGAIYERCTVTVRPHGTAEAVGRLRGPVAEDVAAAGGVLWGVFTPQIGLASDTVVLMVGWPSGPPPGGVEIAPGGAIRGVTRSRWSPTVRPTDTAPLTGRGVYAHRTFRIAGDDLEEFVSLSEQAWPSFEEAFGARICGLFRRADPLTADHTEMLLVTRYPDLATWERSRPRRTDDPALAATRELFVRRHALTRSTIVVTTELAG